MIKNKRISKITMITCLILGRIVNAQEFYTCVPKRSWWMDTMGESIRRNVPSANDIERAVSRVIPAPTPKPQPGWKLIKKFPLIEIDMPLTFGKYMIDFCRVKEFEALDGQSVKIKIYKRSEDKYFQIFILDSSFFDSYWNSCDKSSVELYKYE